VARRHPHGIPPVKCIATSKSTGERCQSWAVVGTTICYAHGLNGGAKRNATTRVTLAQLMETNPRHPWEVVLDMTHTLDAITQEFRAEVLAGETMTVDQLDRLIELAQTTHHLATTAINSKAHEKVSLAFTQHLEMQGRVIGLAIDAVVRGLTTSLDIDSGEQLHDWALAQAHRMLVAAQDGEPAEPPDVEPPPFVLAVVTGTGAGTDARPATIDAPALGAAVPDGAVPDDLTGLDDATIKRLAELLMVEAERRDL
jgi:hypothetical protein